MVKKEINVFGEIRYYNDLHQLHREDGPALELPSGTKFWCLNDTYHRLGGPAAEYSSGTKIWWKHGKKHRLNAPAYISLPIKEFWEFGICIVKI